MSDHHIPPELVIEILKRIPVAALIRFTAVCKAWYSLITNPKFISTHLNHQSRNPPSRRLLLRRYNKDHGKEQYSLHIDDENQTFNNLEIAQIDFPLRAPVGYFRMVGIRNGTICLSDDLFGVGCDIFLFNPSIRKYVALPCSNVNPSAPHMSVLGFGADLVTCDLKVVKVSYYRCTSNGDWLSTEVEIYSLSTGNWRNVEGVDIKCYMVEFMWSQAHVNGVVHWLAYYPRDEDREFRSLVLTFDMSSEVFNEIMLPECLRGEPTMNLFITVIGECLGLLKCDIFGQSCDVWVMKDYGVVESWTRLYSIDLVKGNDKVVAFRKNGEVLISMTDGELVAYDPRERIFTHSSIYGSPRSFCVNHYDESLVLLKGQSRLVGGQLDQF